MLLSEGKSSSCSSSLPSCSRDFSSPSTPPQTTMKKDAERLDILQLYGCFGSPSSKPLDGSPDVVEIMDTPDKQEADHKKVDLQCFDTCNTTYYRQFSDGSKEVAVLTPGPTGFLLAQFGNEMAIETET